MNATLFRIIAISELFGVLLLVLAQQAGGQQGYQFTFGYVASVIIAGAFTAVAGMLLLFGRPLGWQLSVAVQALQVLNFSTATFSYWVTLGPVARIRLQPDGWLTQLGAYGHVWVGPGPAVAPSPEVVVNGLAILLLVALLRTRAAAGRAHSNAVAPAV